MTDDDYDPTIPPEAPTPAAPEPVAVPEEPAPPPAPETAGTDDLREAVGVPRREKLDEPDEDLDDDAPKKKRRTPLVIAIALIAGGAIATVVLLGSANSDRWVFQCGPSRITAERGRSFPPWGTSRLGGPAWKPIEILPETECRTRETGSRATLEGWYLDALYEQAETKLEAKDGAGVDQAQDELEQALLLARDPDRADRRKEIDRLLGDVEYWRGAARVKLAIETLEEAGRRYDAAVDKRPRHANDAAAWAAWVRELASGLRAGPGGLPDTTSPPPATDTDPRPEVPTGVALPVEAPGHVPDAGVAPVTPIDAGIPRGGVSI